MEPRPTDIYDVAVECLEVFEDLTGHVYDESRPQADWRVFGRPTEGLNIQTLRRNFYYWLSCSHAAAEDPEEALDARLLNDRKTKAIVIGLLKILLSRLQRFFHLARLQYRPSSNKFFDLASTHYSNVDPLRTVEEVIDDLENLRIDQHPSIKRLPQISVDCQRPPFAPDSREDLDFEENTIKLLRRKYPNAREPLIKHLASSITYRKRYISQKLQSFEKVGQGHRKEEDIEKLILDPRQQILEGLEPYICLSEECHSPIRYFRLFRDWASHMESTHSPNWPRLIHTSSWVCSTEHPHTEIFQDQWSFESHMNDSLLHPRSGRPTSRRLATLFAVNKKLILRDPFVCPFCEDIPEEVLRIKDRAVYSDSSRIWSRLYEHIGDHVQPLSYLSHPLLGPEHDLVEQMAADNLRSSSKTSLGDNVSQASLYSTTSSIHSSHIPALEVSDKGSLASDYSEDGGLTFQDTEIPDIVDTEVSMSLDSIWTKKLKDIEPSMASHLRKNLDNAARIDLRTRIAKACIDSAMDHRKFVPVTSISELFTQDTVRLELARNDINSEWLLKYTVERCQKIFLILVYIKRIALIEGLIEEGFSDLSLPVTFGENGQGQITIVSSEPESRRTLSTWSNIEANDFYEAQWAFLAPVFSGDTFTYDIHDKRPLPFLRIDRDSERISAFSIVRKVAIHPGHMNFTFLKDTQTIAVKQLAREHPRPDREAEVQWFIRDLDHRHLLKCLAVFRIHGRQTLMFPWANGGNLRDTWQRLDNPHIRNETLVSWVLHQLCGLSSALHCLHNRQWSHGDLKPENILRLSADDDPGLLVIADMGLAEFNDKITLERSSTASSTRRYKDPEDTIYPPKIVSRRSDIWSFGCVAMEFLIWLLYGCEGLQRFQGESESFYSIIQKRVEVNSTTTQWSDYMMDDDPRCRPGTDLRPLLQLIRTRLLVFETPTSVKDEASSSTTITPSNPTKDEPIPDFEIEQANVNHAPMQSYGEAAVSRGRADSKELYETLSEIVRTSKFGSTSRDPPWRELCRLWGPMNKIALPW